jgi:hypothetical protein
MLLWLIFVKDYNMIERRSLLRIVRYWKYLKRRVEYEYAC